MADIKALILRSSDRDHAAKFDADIDGDFMKDVIAALG
jgi:hypothetical protein